MEGAVGRGEGDEVCVQVVLSKYRKGELYAQLCGASKYTSLHVLCGCPWVLREEENINGVHRYTWRHDCVNLEMALQVMEVVTRVNTLPAAESAASNDLLLLARDWEVRADLPDLCDGGRVEFLDSFLVTSARPDILVISEREKIIIIIELTVPHERNMQARAEFKSDKYADLLGMDADWTVYLFTQEHGALLGTANETVDRCWRRLGFKRWEAKRATAACMQVAANCSARIWFSRFTRPFRSSRLMASGRAPADVASVVSAALQSRTVTAALTVADVRRRERNKQFCLQIRKMKEVVEKIVAPGNSGREAAAVENVQSAAWEVIPPLRERARQGERARLIFSGGWCLVCGVKVAPREQQAHAASAGHGNRVGAVDIRRRWAGGRPTATASAPAGQASLRQPLPCHPAPDAPEPEPELDLSVGQAGIRVPAGDDSSDGEDPFAVLDTAAARGAGASAAGGREAQEEPPPASPPVRAYNTRQRAALGPPQRVRRLGRPERVAV